MKDLKECLAPYLPYKLKCICHTGYSGGIDVEQEIIALGESYITYRNTCYQCVDVQFSDIKPLLKPLSLLNEEYVPEMTKGESILSIMQHNYDHLCNEWMHDIDYNIDKENILSAPVFIFNHLISLHYDVFGLIDEGLASVLSEA